MKNLRTNIDKLFVKIDERWKALPTGKQQRYTLCFFTGYLLFTTGVIVKAWYDTTKYGKDITIDHIENPILRKRENPAKWRDSLSTILKNKSYERK